MLIPDNSTVLFIGDSITDTGRNRQDDIDLGKGYAYMTAAWFSAQHPEKQVTFLNRGISGDRTVDLRARWQTDCIDLSPNVVSILIGINDLWRRYDSNLPTPIEEYEDNYRTMLDAVQRELDTRLIICEPFLLPVSENQHAWREDLDPKINMTRRLAYEYGARYVALDGIFASAATRREYTFWTHDGVHPSPAGHALIAQAWLQIIQTP